MLDNHEMRNEAIVITSVRHCYPTPQTRKLLPPARANLTRITSVMQLAYRPTPEVQGSDGFTTVGVHEAELKMAQQR